MTIDDVHRLAMLTGAAPHDAGEDLPLEGFIDGVPRDGFDAAKLCLISRRR